MIHWPLFEAHKYVDIASYSYRRRVPFTPALLLILTSFLLGYLLEKAYARVSGYIRGWRSLLFVTMLLYCCIFASMNYLEENAESERRLLARVPPALRSIGQIHRDLMDIWRHQDEPQPLNATFTMAYNVQFKELDWKLRSCPQRSKRAVPTTYDFARMDITSTCYQQGKGHEEHRNSHAKTAYYGVEYAFRNLYANLTLFSAHQCTIIGMEQKKNLFTAKKYRTTPTGCPKDPPVVDWATDPMMREIQQKFGALAEIAREVVFVPRGHFESGISPHLETLQKRVMYNQDLSMFRTPFWD
ncbi:hypothetical protein M3Y99_01862500 [Aphelenchoides fujianensis]|nr:hypothetical protein M3Y99_01862500 [Aphelenchoides fujianensis]